ncbi:Hypothetical predicted protein [Cloeon dipterum]|uniref:Glycine receptor subunit alpha-4 n=1 Tax=Cloeon dipterum TaxID=197152 RepID=A0A8S1DHC8_9INSE|nr:Hypothetical predicted protein [Cloeon dipterum]
MHHRILLLLFFLLAMLISTNTQECEPAECEAAAAAAAAVVAAEEEEALREAALRHPRRRASAKRARQSNKARRYQHRLAACPGECVGADGVAFNATERRLTLLLLGNVLNTAQRDKLRKCSVGRRLDGAEAVELLGAALETETLSQPTQYVVHVSAHQWLQADPDHVAEAVVGVVDKMAEYLGSVSIYGSDRGETPRSGASAQAVRTIVFEYCRNKQRRCLPLEDLQFPLTVLHKLQLNPSLLDEYNTRFVDLKAIETLSTAVFAPPTPPPPRPLPLHKQLDKLVHMMCERERGRNRFIEMQDLQVKRPQEPAASLGEPGMPPETSLSLGDILPLNPKHYDKNRAPKMAGQPTIVYFHVTVLSLDSINEESMTYVADIFLAQSWRDPRLRLPENMKEEYRILDVDWLRDIWRPDCFFKNAKKVTFHEMSIPNHYLWLYHDKTLLYMSKLTLVLSCAMKFESYPHDTQSCSMMIESLSHTTHDLVFVWNVTDPLVVNDLIELPQLDIASNKTIDCTIEYSTGNFTCLAVTFSLRRRIGYHLFHTYIPSALIVVMSWISFWIKPEAIPARVTLGVTSLLTLATQNTQSQQSLPPVSYVKAIDIWMSSCSVFVFLSLMEFAVVNNYMGPVATKQMKGYSDEDIRSAVDEFKELEPRWNSSSVRNRGGSPVASRVTATQPQYDTFCQGKQTAICIDKFSRFFFPFSFFVLNIVYWTTFL